MARITMRKVQETKLSEVFTLYLASAAARGVKDKTLRTYEQHFTVNATVNPTLVRVQPGPPLLFLYATLLHWVRITLLT